MTDCKRCGDAFYDYRGTFGYSHLCASCYKKLKIGDGQCN